ncbi:prepilin peptidase [Saccharibacillus sp. CPCC 101409]|uniref:prepilin peptidase n=1 Tax=Saccharibacillus sp. CPCC 101409 TaxID=3058041 RepID=UPI0026725A39|nr:A24 family peptidase [Saccharibacillus sp. CPCC 101409]MDO3412044.1 prepilin peptidase [Saccharibacillus sp. CPCC 101409]
MTIFIAIYITIVGLLFGSFFNVVGLRVPVGESIVHPPSRCSNCNTRLGAKDMVPVFSYLFSKGKCRHCGVKVSPIYPLFEAATGLLFLWTFLRFGLSGAAVIGLMLVSLCVIVTVADLKYMLIPNKVLLFFAPILIVLRFVFMEAPWWHYVLGGALGGGIILLIALLTKGMGMGDVKLFALCGIVLGIGPTLLAFMLACALGSIVGGLLILLKIVQRRQPVPFGPWLALATLIAYGYGTQIIGGYLSLIG